MAQVEPCKPTYGIVINVDSSSIDITIEKANRLVELLQEASSIIDSLSGRTDIRTLID